MSEFSKLRMELKAEIELIAIRQGDMANGVEAMSGRIAEQGRQIAEQGKQIAEQGKHIARQAERMHVHANETAGLGREVAEGSRWMQGRMRLLNQRFDAVLGALEQDSLADRERLSSVEAQQQDLELRVSRLEQGRSPAA